ncbi:MAG TPA: aldehyde dehydrogenase family protein, partial [Stenomitos sp.]
MSFQTLNPYTGELVAEFAPMDDSQLAAALSQAAEAAPRWAALSFPERAGYLHAIARVLRSHQAELARLATLEMGKLNAESAAEVEKCAWVCDYYAEHAAEFLKDEAIATESARSLVTYEPLGTILGIMPWNFPYWQVLRFAAPALMAGNTILLKHAPNVPQCAQALERVAREAGLPAGVFLNLMIPVDQVERVVSHPAVQGVSLTGSVAAGRKVAALAGAYLRKTVLELGGSDAFVVLEDADLDGAVRMAVTARFLNAGQSCIAAKRFILVESVAEAFLMRFKEAVAALAPGDPMRPATTLAPMARRDLRDALHAQVQASLRAGAVPVLGCEPVPGPGFFYRPSILDRVRPGMPAYEEELFGPVASILRARDA